MLLQVSCFSSINIFSKFPDESKYAYDCRVKRFFEITKSDYGNRYRRISAVGFDVRRLILFRPKKNQAIWTWKIRKTVLEKPVTDKLKRRPELLEARLALTNVK